MSGLDILAVLAFAVFAISVARHKQKRLSDPTDTSKIYVDQMLTNHQLPNLPVVAALIRQSGNIYRDLGVLESPAAAITEIVKSFRKAQIDSVSVVENTAAAYEVVRLHHSHRGRAEGKKLGGARVVPAGIHR